MTSPNLPVETDRLYLRPFDHGDLDGLAAYYALPDLQRYLDWRARDQAEVKSALHSLVREVALNRPGDCLSLAVERKSDNGLVGHVCLRWHDATAAQAELKFGFNPIYRRQAYASEALKAALTLGFEEFDFHRIFARCDARSQASARLLKGLGLRLEAHYREHALFQGEWDEELHFAVLDREWERDDRISEFHIHRVA